MGKVALKIMFRQHGDGGKKAKNYRYHVQNKK